MKLKLLYLAGAIHIGFCCFAQTKTTDPAKIKILKDIALVNTENDKKQLAGYNFTPFGSSSLSNILSNVSLSSTLNKGENGKVELKYNSKSWTTIGLTIDQKIGKDAKEAIPFDFIDGLSPGTTVSFNLQQMIWNPVFSEENFAQFDNAANAYAARTRTDRRVVTFNDIQNHGNATEKGYLQGIALKQPFFFNIKASITKTEFNFATDSFTLAENNATHLSPGISAFIGFPNISKQSFFSIGYNYSISYNAADETTFDSPFGSSSSTFSRTLIFGKPAKKTDNKLALEWRKNFMSSSNTVNFGLGPSMAYGFTSKKLSLVVPVYFINSKDADGKPTGLQGGIKLGYSTSTTGGKISSFKKGFATQLIVTAPFNIFENL